MKSHTNKILESIKQALTEHLPKGGKALLFGSQARGDARIDSDWDILIILDKEKLEPEDYDKVSFPLTMLGWDLGARINPIMYTMKEWAASCITPFYKNVEQAGIELGIYPKDAQKMVAQSVKGAASLILNNDTHPSVEIDKVCTPGGMTIKGINELDHEGFDSAIIKAMKACLK